MARPDRGFHPIPARAPKTLRSLEDHPALPALLPALAPRTLMRLYDAVGLHDAGGLMALTPAVQLVRALGEAVWTHEGVDTRFDPDAFVDWLEVWLGEGEIFAAERLLLLEEDFLTLCFAAVVRVADADVEGFERTVEEQGDELPDAGLEGTVLGRFLITPALEDEWDVVHQAVVALWDHDPERALILLERLAHLPAGADPGSTLQRDAAAAREADQEGAGFVPPAAARAFLASAGTLTLADLCAMSDYDPETHRHLARRAAARVARPKPTDGTEASIGAPLFMHPESSADAAATLPPELRDLLSEAGGLDRASPASLLAGPAGTTILTLRRRLDDLAVNFPERLAHPAAELAWLANVLITRVELRGYGGHPEDQARELAFATASLGIELLESQGLDVVLGEPPGLVRAFLVAWRALGELPAALVGAFERAFDSPAMTAYLAPRHWLRGEMHISLRALATAVAESRLGTAREAVGLLSLVCDTAACRAAAHLLDNPPRFPRLMEGGGKDEARWIRSLGDLERLSALLGGLGPKG